MIFYYICINEPAPTSKMSKSTHIPNRNIRLCQRKSERERKRWKLASSRNRILKQTRGKGRASGKEKKRKDKTISYKETIFFPKRFKFIGNFEDINSLITDIIEKANQNKDKNGKKSFIFDMKEVEELDTASINVLLTLTNYLTILGYDVYGNTPSDQEAKDILRASGFFSHVATSFSVPSCPNTIFTISGDNKTDEDAIGREIRKIHKSLTGTEDSYLPLYTTLGEIAANSVEHANRNNAEKNWFMSVHNEEEKALIMMADIGEGILNTLNLLFKQETANKLWREKPHEVLKSTFAGKYQSSTRDPNRNTGLPDMVPRVKSNYIENIIVVANNAVYDFSDKLSRTLNTPFPGTFYLLEVTKKNIEVWQNRLK